MELHTLTLVTHSYALLKAIVHVISHTLSKVIDIHIAKQLTVAKSK